jgi:hypothetical protein
MIFSWSDATLHTLRAVAGLDHVVYGSDYPTCAEISRSAVVPNWWPALNSRRPNALRYSTARQCRCCRGWPPTLAWPADAAAGGRLNLHDRTYWQVRVDPYNPVR